MASGKVTPGVNPFDAVLIVSFGGPEGPADVRPFLEHVLRGRRVPPERVEEVARNYQRFGGVSPLSTLVRRQAAGLQEQLERAGLGLRVYVGMRHWHPFVADTLSAMADRGVRRAIAFITAAHHSYSSCGQYRDAVREARRALVQQGRPDVEITYVESWYDHAGFVTTVAAHIEEALERLPADRRGAARIVFTAHSIPTTMASGCRYVEQLTTTARLVAERLGRTDWALVYQSRSGPPQQPWLEPDVCDYLRTAHREGVAAVVLAPVGFVCDHIEVLYDLDTQAAGVCAELGLPMARAQAVNDDPRFIDMMAELVLQTYERYRRSGPLSIASGGTGTPPP